MGWLFEKRSDADLRAYKQEQIDKIRRGGYRKTAARAQARLDKKGGKKK